MELSRSERLVLVLLSVAILAGRFWRMGGDRSEDLLIAADSIVAAESGVLGDEVSSPPEAAHGARQESGRGARAHGESSAGAPGRSVGEERVDAAPLDLNEATEEELVSLPGIGPTKARAIVERREAAGPFTSVSDLLSVKGIGPKTLARLDGLVVVKDADRTPEGTK